MTRSRKTTPDSPLSSTLSQSGTEGELFKILQGLAACLVVARLLEPTERSVLGQTLWLTPLWFLLAAVWAINAWRRNISVRFGAIDLAVWVVVAGHIVSGISVLLGAGDKRAALNMLWEWLALGTSFFLLRQLLQSRDDGLRLATALVAVAVSFAGLGLWQHYVTMPRMLDEYVSLQQELDEIDTNRPQNTREQARRRQEIQREFARMRVPAEESARMTWWYRLTANEPCATFDLPNTLGGFLLAWWLVGAGIFRGAGRAGVKRRWLVVWVVSLLLVAYCLVLTKSRSAWAGLLAGLAIWCIGVRGRSRPLGRWVGGGLIAAAGVAALFAVAALSRGFDARVISDAPTSLRYRLEYWITTWEVVQDFPLLGTGPGNFRPHYLRHKLPGTSEEITSPHNILLDVWVSGGLLALLGLLAVAWFAAVTFRRNIAFDERAEGNALPSYSWQPGIRAIDVGACAGFLLAIAAGYYLKAALSPTSFLLLALWLIVRGAASPVCQGIAAVPRIAVIAASIAIFVHLLASSGIEMPAITQTVLVLLVIGFGPADPAQVQTKKKSLRVGHALLGCVAMILFVACLITATLPVQNCAALIHAADVSIVEDRDLQRAARLYEQAAARDPLSPEALLRLANLKFHQWRTNTGASERDFDQAVRYARLALERVPESPFAHQQLGNWFWVRYERSGRPEDARMAAQELQEAVNSYPHHAGFRADLAIALNAIFQTQSSAEHARVALQLDDLNTARGHGDKLLPREKRQALVKIADSP